MRLAARIALMIVTVMALVRLVLFFWYAIQIIPITFFQAFHLESKMVHLAWRVQSGESLYPEWRRFPHVSNFFAPLYFVLVGRIGRHEGASLEGLYLIGRLVSFAATIGTSMILSLDAGRRYGRGAAILAALMSQGVGPLYGYGVMTRPDTLADLLGLAGFLAVARGRTRAATLSGLALLVLAIFTKQTAAVYALAAAATLAITGRRREAGWLGAGVLVCVGLVVMAVNATLEPRFASSLLAERKTPWSWTSWLWTGYRLVATDPEWIALSVAGLWLWNRPNHRDPAMTVLTLILLPVLVITIAKQGSDLNYALPFRAVTALAAAALWDAVFTEGRSDGPAAWLALLSVGCLSIGYSDLHSTAHWANAGLTRDVLRMPQGRMLMRLHEQIYKRMADPSTPVLTDSSQFDIRQGRRTAFGDPWLFHLLVDTGEIDPATMRGWVESEYYDWIITTKDLLDPSYDTYDFGLPSGLVTPARQHYEFSGSAGGYYFYRPHRLSGVTGNLLP